jgi:hypothetical protein
MVRADIAESAFHHMLRKMNAASSPSAPNCAHAKTASLPGKPFLNLSLGKAVSPAAER